VAILRAEAFNLKVLSLPCLALSCLYLVLFCLALHSVVFLLLFSSHLLSVEKRKEAKNDEARTQMKKGFSIFTHMPATTAILSSSKGAS
jgi:hypothetical protein